jgi:hypothetical protein
MNDNLTDPPKPDDPIPAPKSVEVKFGRITFISPDKGAFVELISQSAEQQTLQTKTELFVSKELLANLQLGSQALSIDQLVQVTKIGEKIVDIKPY